MALATISCSSDDGDDGDNPNAICSQLATFSPTYLDTFNAFQTNPNAETCNGFRNTVLDLINAIENCPELAEQYSELEESAQAWTDLDCSQDFD